MELIQHSITQHPIRVALIWRFSFLPEFMKNFGLAVLPLKTWQFVVAVMLHGLPFTALWTFLGREMGLVVRCVFVTFPFDLCCHHYFRWRFCHWIIVHGITNTDNSLPTSYQSLFFRGVVPHPSKTLKLIISGVYIFGTFV